VGTLHHWWEVILNYFLARLNSGFVEGLNNKLKLIKRRAFGFRNFTHFRLRVLSACQGAT
jgi:transposase